MSSSEEVSSPVSPDVTKNGKKRKRTDAPAEELEIDVNLPEPPSKKALRRAKKGKTGPAPKASVKDQSDLQELDGEDKAQADQPEPTGTTHPERSLHGIWIGNLAFHITPTALRDFLTTKGALEPEHITRINLPVTNKPLAPFQIRLMKTQGKADIPQFQNKGFAYVDFSSPDALFQALQLTETALEGRNVLIKDAKNFAGRLDKAKPEPGGVDGAAAPPADSKPRSKRIFVGNLAFDVTRADLETHFAQAGGVEDVFLASFEDSGKCKGYGWVRFTDEDSAERAVKGWILKTDEADGDDEEEEEDGEGKTEAKAKKRKWWINKLFGRQLRCEFAEDPTTRYRKRYGKGGSKREDAAPAATEEEAAVPERRGGRGTAEERSEQRRKKHRDARKVAPGQALANAPRASGAIVEAKGKKVTFDD